MAINARKLRQDVANHGSELIAAKLTEAIELGREGESGGLSSTDFSIRALAEAFLGHDSVSDMDPSVQNQIGVMESSDAVDSTAFLNITGQIVINEVMSGYEQESMMATALFRNVPTRLSGEKKPGFAGIGDAAEQVHEGMPYPHAGIGEDFIETPQTAKHGLIVPITKEAVFFDRTGQILEHAKKTGEYLGLNKEKRCIDTLIGATNTFKWRGTGYNTYQRAAGSPWVNELKGAEYRLEDWTDVEAAENLFDDIVDPNTGESIEFGGSVLIAPRRKRHTINRILNATEVRHKNADGSFETLAKNPLSGEGYTSMTNRRFYRRLQTQLGLTAAEAENVWLYGDPSKAFMYMENWGITTVQAPVNNEAEFTQDIIARFKSSERGTPAIDNPRYMARIMGF